MKRFLFVLLLLLVTNISYAQSIFWLNRPNDNVFKYLGSQTWTAQTSTTITQNVTVPDCGLIVLSIHSMVGTMSSSSSPTLGSDAFSEKVLESYPVHVKMYDIQAGKNAGTYTLTVYNPDAANLYITMSWYQTPVSYLLYSSSFTSGTDNNPTGTINSLLTNNNYLLVDGVTLQAYSGSSITTPTSSGTRFWYGISGAVFGSGAQYSIFRSSSTSVTSYYNTVNIFNWYYGVLLYRQTS